MISSFESINSVVTDFQRSLSLCKLNQSNQTFVTDSVNVAGDRCNLTSVTLVRLWVKFKQPYVDTHSLDTHIQFNNPFQSQWTKIRISGKQPTSS